MTNHDETKKPNPMPDNSGKREATVPSGANENAPPKPEAPKKP